MASEAHQDRNFQFRRSWQRGRDRPHLRHRCALLSSLCPLNLRAKSGICSRKETAAARLATLKIWQASCVAGALTATSLAVIYQVAVSRPSVVTPNARVADAFSAIPLNV